MLSEEEIKALIVVRLEACYESCNSRHINHVEGQVRALIAVLNNGRIPDPSGDALDLLKAAGIPFHDKGDGSYDHDDKWLIAHGFEIDGDDISHPTLGDW